MQFKQVLFFTKREKKKASHENLFYGVQFFNEMGWEQNKAHALGDSRIKMH